MTADEALAQLVALGDPVRAEGAAAYHKVARRYLGVSVPEITDLATSWREGMTPDERAALADTLWQTDIHEARVAAAKLLTQARIRPDDAVWTVLLSWVPSFDAWAIADHACDAIERRLLADPSRLDVVESWTRDPSMWVRRAALVATLPWTKMNFPKADDIAIRDRVLGWAAGYADDRDWFIQKAIAWWLRDLSRRDAPRVRAFLEGHGARMKPFARKEALRLVQER